MPTPRHTPNVTPEAITEFALRSLVDPLTSPPPSSEAPANPHLATAELRPVLDELAHLDPLSSFQQREQIAPALLAGSEPGAHPAKPIPALKKPGGGAPGQGAKAHQPSQKWVTRRFA